MSDARTLLDDLSCVDSIKTWSLIITMLGDFGNHGDASMSGKEINAILGHVGIKPEAVRVALHRLKKDGWLDTTKVGREVIYQLSKNGLEQTNAAYTDVYREDVKYPDGWQLTLNPQYETALEEHKLHGIMLLKNVFLIPHCELGESEQFLEIEFDKNAIPSWFENKLVPAKILNVAKELTLLAEHFLASSKSLNDLDRVAVRLLFLHHWRKMALKENTWAHIWLCPEDVIAHYHRQVFEIFKRLPKPKN